MSSYAFAEKINAGVLTDQSFHCSELEHNMYEPNKLTSQFTNLNLVGRMYSHAI